VGYNKIYSNLSYVNRAGGWNRWNWLKIRFSDGCSENGHEHGNEIMWNTITLICRVKCGK
jgi:hypothetical protein